MNLRLVAYNLGIMTLLMACAMVFCMVWALPYCGGVWVNEARGVLALSLSILLTGGLSALFFRLGRTARRATFFRREAIAVVGLGWICVSICGALPYFLSGVPRTVLEDGTRVPMTAVDSLYESVSGITTTGVSVFGELEDPTVMPRTILFWRSMTHFIGGVGIVVLLVALLDTGMAGRLLVQREIAGPRQTVKASRIQMVMRRTLTVYLTLNVVLILLLMLCGLNCFDSLCHSFGTIATGGMSSRNSSFGFVRLDPNINAAAAEWIEAIFIGIAGMNFMSLYFCALGDWKPLLKCREWQTYVLLILVSVLIVAVHQRPVDFRQGTGLEETIRNSLFHVTSCITTTGYSTCNFTLWETCSQMVILGLMFVSACSGSTTGGFKVVRYVLLFKILHLELEKVYRPAIVRPLCFNGERVRDPSIASGVLIFFAMAFLTIGGTWLLAMFLEPDSLWAGHPALMACKAHDLFAASVSHFANVGLGMGIFGAETSFGVLTQPTKFLFLCVMLLGRLDFFAILLLFTPAFWKK